MDAKSFRNYGGGGGWEGRGDFRPLRLWLLRLPSSPPCAVSSFLLHLSPSIFDTLQKDLNQLEDGARQRPTWNMKPLPRSPGEKKRIERRAERYVQGGREMGFTGWGLGQWHRGGVTANSKTL